MLERGDERLAKVPQYPVREHDITTELDGFAIKGRLDGFDPIRCRFLDHKSGHADRSGKAPWNRVKVFQLDQLPFYSMLVKEKYGKVDPVCHLVWLETEFETKTTEFAGRTLYSQTRDLKLTGRVKKFRRYISKWERERIKKDVIEACKEIAIDYENYQKTKERSDAGTGEGIAQEKPTIA